MQLKIVFLVKHTLLEKTMMKIKQKKNRFSVQIQMQRTKFPVLLTLLFKLETAVST